MRSFFFNLFFNLGGFFWDVSDKIKPDMVPGESGRQSASTTQLFDLIGQHPCLDCNGTGMIDWDKSPGYRTCQHCFGSRVNVDWLRIKSINRNRAHK